MRLKGGKLLLDLSEINIFTLPADGSSVYFPNIKSEEFRKIEKEISVKLNYKNAFFVIPLTDLEDWDGTLSEYHINFMANVYVLQINYDEDILNAFIVKQ